MSVAVIATSTEIIIPCYRIVRTSFNPKVEFNDESRWRRDAIKLRINNTNFRGGIPSLFNDNPNNSFTGFDLDPIWINDCINYMVELPMYERLTIHAYTHNGDVIANMILRNKSDDEIYEYVSNADRSENKKTYFCIFFQIRKVLSKNNYSGVSDDMRKDILSENLIDSYGAVVEYHQDAEIPRQCLLDASRLYVEDLINIINRAPSLPSDCTVYRGVTSLFYSINNKKTFKNEGFLSTSYSPVAAHQFTNSFCCLKKFKIKRGTKALFMECITENPDEFEILFPPDLEFRAERNKIATYIDIETDVNTPLTEILCQQMGKKRSINLTVMQQV